MANLLEKIAEYTVDGSPGVSQLIELQELARKEKVSKTSLEKLIQESIANQTTIEESEVRNETKYPEKTFSRPDFDSARNSFDEEMDLRRKESSISIEREIDFDQNDIVFPELNVTFDNNKKEEEEYVVNEKVVDNIPVNIDPVKEEKIAEIVESFQNTVEEIIPTEIDIRKRQLDETLKTNQARIAQTSSLEELKNELFVLVELGKGFEVETDFLNSLKQELSNRIKLQEAQQQSRVSREAEEKLERKLINIRDNIYNLKSLNEVRSELNILRNLVASYGKPTKFSQRIEKDLVNREMQFQAGKISTEQIEKAQQIVDARKKEIKQQNSSKTSTGYGYQTELKEANQSFVIAIVSIVLSFIFGAIGGAVAIYVLGLNKKANNIYNANPGAYSKKVKDKIKNAKIIAIIALVIGGLKLLRFLSFNYYGLYY